MAKEFRHFSTREDLLSLLARAEEAAGGPLHFYLTGSYPEPDTPEYHGAASLPSPGVTDVAAEGGACYLLYDRPVDVFRRPVPQVPEAGGGVRYLVDPWKNPPCVLFSGGGLYRDELMVSGLVETSATDRAALALFGRLRKAAAAAHAKVRYYHEHVFVGPVAMELLRAGMRFTHAKGSSPKLDLRLDA
jgi:hypothetical protein